MRLALGQLPDATPELLAFAAQLGLDGVQLNTPRLPGEREWAEADLVALRERCEAAGLRLEAIENVPNRFYERTMLGLPGRDEEIEHVQVTIRNIGRAGIPILGYHFMPASVWRTSVSEAGRGGSLVTAYDHAIATDPARADEVFVARRDQRRDDPFVRAAHFATGVELDDEAMWANYRYFMEAVVPVAESAGVRLALHPDDPPVPTLGGIARLFRSVASLERAMELVPSPSSGLDLCLGTVSEMGGEPAVLEAIDRFGPRGWIVYVHLRDVQGIVPRFAECFLGEGNYDPLRVLRALRRVGFDGFLLDDHVPRMVDDSEYMHRGRAHAVGLIQGLLRTAAEEADGLDRDDRETAAP
jgi:mannonate dehydratase